MLFLACAVNDAQAKALLGECNGFGISYYFDKNCEYKKYKNSDALKITIVKKIKGKVKKLIRWVIFAGAGKSDSYKSIRGLSIEGLIGSEFNLFHPDFLNEVKNRTVAAINPKFFYDMNPTNEGNFVYKEYIDNKRLDVNYVHATLVDNPSLSEKRIKDIINEYDPDSINYKAMILGQRVNIEGSIYTIRDYNILKSFDPRDYIEYITICDPGENQSGTAMVLAALYFNNELKQYEIHILKEYWHRNADYKSGYNIKLPKDYAEDYVTFVRECANLLNDMPKICLLDEDITFYREIKLCHEEVPLSLFKYPIKSNIDARVKTGINLLYRGKLRFYGDCKNAIGQFKNAVYDAKECQKGNYIRMDNPAISNIDFCDAIEYSFEQYSRYLTI